MIDYSSRLLEIFFKRRSIRKFSSQPVRETDVRKIVEVGQCAPTACNFQNYSVVWVKDSKLKKKVLNTCGVARSIISAPVVFVICADVRRLERVLDHLADDYVLNVVTAIGLN